MHGDAPSGGGCSLSISDIILGTMLRIDVSCQEFWALEAMRLDTEESIEVFWRGVLGHIAVQKPYAIFDSLTS